MKRRKGFTLVELLVVIAIIALLMGILMPALARVRAIAYRLVCGTNLSGIGKSMILYANDYDEEYPVAGQRGVGWSTLDKIPVWDDSDLNVAIPTNSDATVTSALFLLVKWYDASTKQFVCKGDGAKAFEFGIAGAATDIPTGQNDFGIEDVWDFGTTGNSPKTQPGDYCSYSYHYPFPADGYSLSVSSSPSSPLAADRNPWLDKNATTNLNDGTLLNATWNTTTNKYEDPDKKENSAAHGFEGQNVLYNDIHVSFEKKPNVGIQNDNIWKRWQNNPPTTEAERQVGTSGSTPTGLNTGGTTNNLSEDDAYLINETQS